MVFQRGMAVLGTVLVLGLGLAACSEEAPPPPKPRLVRTTTVKVENVSDAIQGTGQVQARYTANVGFQVGGRLIERKVELGASVKTGDLLARLDPAEQQQKVAQAQAQVAAAQAAVTQTAAQEQRQATLLKDGYATQARYDDALRALKTAQADLQNAQAALKLAQDQLGYTTLTAANDGVITLTGPDPGQVVNAGQTIVQIAQPGELDAIFGIGERAAAFAQPGMPIKVWLQSDPAVKAAGTLREIAPSADPVTRTYQVKVTLANPPDGFRLGAVIVGEPDVEAKPVVTLTSTAILQTADKPAVWIVDPKALTVHRQPVAISRFDTDTVVVSDGLKAGDVVVTAGVNVLAEGQQVRLGDAP